jgi:predicted neuraminidase
MFSAEFLHIKSDIYPNAHCATITMSPKDDLLAAWYAYPEEESKDACLVLARKEHGGTKWSKGTILDFGMTSSLGNPVPFYDPHGRLWMHFIALKGRFWDSGIWMSAYSDDDGVTWSTPSTVCQEPGIMIRHTPIVCPNGQIIMPVYDEKISVSLLYASTPPYSVWSEIRRFDGFDMIQPCLIQTDSGLINFFRPHGKPFNTWRSASTDGGKNWSNPVRLALPNPLSGVAAFEVDGQVGLVFNNSTDHKRYPLSVSFGNSSLHEWSEAKDFDTAQFEVSYPSFLADRQGIVHGVYTYNRRFIKYVTFDAEWMGDA